MRRKPTSFKLKSAAQSSGFTLIEMIIAISISVLFIGGFVLVVGSIYTEKDIRKPAGELEILAQRVRTIATVHQRTYQIFLREEGIFVLPFGETPEEQPQTDWKFLADKDAELEPPLSHPTIREFHEIDAKIDFLVKGWGMKEFRALDDKFSYAWQFEPSGMTEPISVRFEMLIDGQTSWLEQTYHPLTGAVTDESMEVCD